MHTVMARPIKDIEREIHYTQLSIMNTPSDSPYFDRLIRREHELHVELACALHPSYRETESIKYRFINK
jgi:hypothetical protein